MINQIFKTLRPLSFMLSATTCNNIIGVDTVALYQGGIHKPCNANFSGPVTHLCLLMLSTVNSLFKRKTKATIEFSGQVLLSGQKFELIRT